MSPPLAQASADEAAPQASADRRRSLATPARLRGSAVTLGRLRDVSLLVLAVFLTQQNYHAFRDFVFEDAFITYHYANNLAQGHGFVFNPGERVLGTSTPLYTLVLALLRLLGFEVSVASGVLSVLCVTLVGLTGAWLLRREGAPNLGALFAVLVFSGAGSTLVYHGMETSFYALLLFLALLSALQKRETVTGVLLALCCLTRYDGVLFAAFLTAGIWFTSKKLPWRTCVAAAVVATPWLIFAALYFGSVLPNTLAAKSGDVSADHYLYVSAAGIVRELSAGWTRLLPVSELPRVVFPALTVAFVGPIFSRLAELFRRQPLLSVLLAQPILLWIGYALIGPPVEHRWYWVPTIYFLLVLGLLCWNLNLKRQRLAPWSTVATLILILASFLVLPEQIADKGAGLRNEISYRQRIEDYALLADWVQAHRLDDLKVATLEPGYFSYRSGNAIVDLAGLVTAGIYFHGPTERRTTFEELVVHHRPEMLLYAQRAPQLPTSGEFVPIFQGAVHGLHLRRDLLTERRLDIARSWLADDFPYPQAVELGHPLTFDFEDGDAGGWWGAPRLVGRPVELHLAGAPIEDTYLTTHDEVTGRATSVVMSPPFRLDFDVLALRLYASGHQQTTVQLLVNGLAVHTADGRGSTEGEMRELRWSVFPWRGKVATVRLVDEAADGFLAVDQVLSGIHQDVVALDDFETGTFSERWAKSFVQGPRPYDQLVDVLGPQFIIGRFSALSLFTDGEQALVSEPFTVDRERLAMVVFDFGNARTSVELRHRGEVVHRFAGARTMRPVSLVWPLGDLIGEEVELAIVDGDPRRWVGIGIDEIRLFDWTRGIDRRSP